MGKPKFRTYEPRLATDGLTTQERHYFDNTVEWTDDDEAKFEAALLDMEPETLMAKLQSNLDGLQDITPAIRLHADAIREILARLSNPLTDRTRNRNDEIDRAFDLWRKIILLRDMLPKARKGSKFKPGKPKGSLGPVAKKINLFSSVAPCKIAANPARARGYIQRGGSPDG